MNDCAHLIMKLFTKQNLLFHSTGVLGISALGSTKIANDRVWAHMEVYTCAHTVAKWNHYWLLKIYGSEIKAGRMASSGITFRVDSCVLSVVWRSIYLCDALCQSYENDKIKS